MAFSCNDPALTFLNKFGYNVVKMPRAGIDPLLVLGRDKALNPIGPLSTVWRAEQAPPAPGPPQAATSVEGQKSEKLDLSIGLKLLANALAAFGATTPSLEFAYSRARKVQFTFTNVKSVSIDPFTLGDYLASGDLNLQNPFVSRYFDDDDTNAYIVTEVLKSDTVTVTATDSNEVGVKLDVPAISNVVGASVKISGGGDSSGTLSYTGPDAVTFGFRAFEIIYADGRWSVKGIKPSGDLAFFHDDNSTDAIGEVFNRGGLVRI